MNSDVYGLIYCLTCSVTGKKYIGQTTQTAKARWRQHRTERRRNNTHITRALTLHGVETFTMSVIDTASDQADLDQKEIYWIRQEGTLSPHGYNLNEGGVGGGKRSPETRAKMSESQRKRTHPPEIRAKISAHSSHHSPSPETLVKLRAYAQNKSPEHREAIRKSNRERVYTPEMLARISAAQKARWERVRAARNSG